ncbi:hypothetical protein HDV64DRAFT_234617 [Trichoderma sp. TUCIM 5745]
MRMRRSSSRSAVPLISPKRLGTLVWTTCCAWPSHCLRSATIDRRPSPQDILFSALRILQWGGQNGSPDALRLSKCSWSRLQPTTHDAPSGGLHGLNRHAAHKMPNARVYKACVSLHPPQAASSTSVPALAVLLQRLLVGVSPRASWTSFRHSTPLCHALYSHK